MRNRILLATLGAVSVLLPVGASGYEILTHDDITQTAARRSTLDEVLRARLGVANGLDTVIRGLGLVEWLAQGGRREDEFLRLLNHFHTPLADWSAAGLLGSIPESAGPIICEGGSPAGNAGCPGLRG